MIPVHLPRIKYFSPASHAVYNNQVIPAWVSRCLVGGRLSAVWPAPGCTRGEQSGCSAHTWSPAHSYLEFKYLNKKSFERYYNFRLGRTPFKKLKISYVFQPLYRTAFPKCCQKPVAFRYILVTFSMNFHFIPPPTCWPTPLSERSSGTSGTPPARRTTQRMLNRLMRLGTGNGYRSIDGLKGKRRYKDL